MPYSRSRSSGMQLMTVAYSILCGVQLAKGAFRSLEDQVTSRNHGTNHTHFVILGPPHIHEIFEKTERRGIEM